MGCNAQCIRRFRTWHFRGAIQRLALRRAHPCCPIPRADVTSVALGVGIGNPGAIPASRYDIYYHIETGSGTSIVRHGLPFEGTLPPTMAKIVPPPSGTRYLALDVISPNIPITPRWADRFQSKYNLHPAIYQFIGAGQAMDVQTVSSYIASIQLAAARGMVPAVQMNVGTVTDNGNWTYQEIVDGVHDQAITQIAQAIHDLGYPVIGFVGEEFNKISDRVGSSCGPSGTSSCSTNNTFTASDANQYGDPNYPDGPERYRDATRHIVDLFDEVGATNVTKIIMTNNATYDIVGQPWDAAGNSDSWWDAAWYYYPGPDYLDITGTQVYNNYPNPDGLTFTYPSVQQAYSRHKNGYFDWTPLAPSDMFAIPDEIQTYGTYPAAANDRSPLIVAWYNNMANFPLLQYFGLYEDGADNNPCLSNQSSYCINTPGLFVPTGIPDYGFYHPEEIDTFRAGEAGAGWVQAPYFSTQVAAPAKITTFSVVSTGPGTAALAWTAPGAEGVQGTADHYTLRCRTTNDLSASTWSRQETLNFTAPAPQSAGTVQQVTLSQLVPDTYACAIKATNQTHMNAPLSNIVTFSIVSQ